MIGLTCVVAASDFSAASDRAVSRAAALASSLGSALQLIHVLPPVDLLVEFLPAPPDAEIAALRTRAGKALQDRAHRAAASFAVSPEWTLFHGQAHREILAAAEKVGADLVVVGAQGEHEGAASSKTLGDTAFKLAQDSKVPVLLVRGKRTEPYHAVVACAKGERPDGRVIEWANGVSPDSLLHIVSAYRVPYEERLKAWGASESSIDLYATMEREKRTRHLGGTLSDSRIPAARAQLHVERGMPLQVILGTAARWSADLIVVGRRAQPDPFGGGDFGSVARAIAVLAPMDVLVVPPRTAGLGEKSA